MAAEPRPVRSALYLVLALGVPAFVLAAALSLLPAPAAAGLSAACSAAFAVAMIRAALGDRSAGPRPRALILAGGSLLTALAAAASGIAVVVAPDMLVAEVPLPAEIPLVSLFIVTGLYLAGVLRPHQPRGPLARIRTGLDTLGVAVCLVYTPWLLLFSTGEQRGASITAIMLGAGAAAIAAAAGVHAVRHRAALLWCGPGAALSLIGLTALVVAMDFPGKANAAIAAGAAAVAVNAAAAMLWYGTVRVRPDAGPLPHSGSEPTAGFPLFALPLFGSALATVFHLIHGRELDAVSIILAATGVVAVAAREYTSAVALRRHADHLTDQGNRLRNLVFGYSDVAMVLDADLAVRWQSPAAARQFGLSDQDVLGRPASALVHPAEVEALLAHLTARMGSPADAAPTSHEVRLRDGFGRWRATEWATNGADPAEPGRSLVVHIRDISERRDLEQTLRQAAHIDRQTTLANRQGLRRAGEPVPDAGAMIVIELGGLATIGDVHGPDLAEVVVVEAARRLRIGIESTDVPARLGEARFAVLTRCGAVRAHLLASQLLNELTAPYTAAGTVTQVSAWAGLADLTADADIDEVIRRAVLALRSVLSGRPGAVEWYDEAMEIRLLRRSTLEQDLPRAISRGELDLTYQPIVELPGRRPVGVEVLLHWRHGTLGTVPADELLSLAEDLGLLGEVGNWVLHRAFRQLAGWRRQHASLWMAVNVRPRQLVDPVFQAALHTALSAHQIPPSALVIEMAEPDLVTVRGDAAQSSVRGDAALSSVRGSAALSSVRGSAAWGQPDFPDVAGQLGQLRAEGIRTAVDNFGTGPTSLSQLRVLPVDLLKIDRDVFAQPTDRSRQLDTIMDVTVTLARRLGLEVIAQGMQTPADLETVQAAGCRLGQGDLLGRALQPEYVEALLDKHRDPSSRDR